MTILCRCGQPESDLTHDREASNEGRLPKGAYHKFEPAPPDSRKEAQ